MLVMDESKSRLAFPQTRNRTNGLFAPHFGLRKLPFTSSLDRRWYFPHESALEVINTLQYAMRTGEGITKIIGESGSGKTYVVSNLLSTMSEEFFVIKVLDPAVSPRSLLKSILDEMCIEYSNELSNQQLIKAILSSLCEFYSRAQTPVIICIDNAERMPIATLVTVSILNNLETQHRKLLQTILIGTSELDRTLERPALKSLHQKISFSAEMRNLKKDELREYIKDRVRKSGDDNVELFSQDAIDALYKVSYGVPRLVNLLSYKSMMLAYGQGMLQVNKTHVYMAAEDTRQIKDVQQHKFPVWGYIPFVFSFAGLIALLVYKVSASG